MDWQAAPARRLTRPAGVAYQDAAAIRAKIIKNNPPNIAANSRAIRRVSGRGLKLFAGIDMR